MKITWHWPHPQYTKQSCWISSKLSSLQLHFFTMPSSPVSLSSTTFPLIFYNTNMLSPLLPLLTVPAQQPPIRRTPLSNNSSDLASLSLTQWWPSRHHSTESEYCLKIFHRITKGKHCFNVRPPILPQKTEKNTRNTSGLWHQTQWNADRRMPLNFNPLTKAVWTRTRICETNIWWKGGKPGNSWK